MGVPGSLRQAIIDANTSAGADTITFASGGTYSLTIAGTGEDAAATGDLDITDDLTIIGAGTGSTIIDANSLDRVFQVHSGTVTISDLTIQGGLLGAGQHGAGVAVESSASLTLDTVTVTGNQATGGVNSGGGLYNAGTLTIVDSSISNNVSGSIGGGLYNVGTASLSQSLVAGNTATNNGGGIYHTGVSTLDLTNVTISGNTAPGNGGGIYSEADVNATNITVTNNQSTSFSGGGVRNSVGTFTLTNSIIAGNLANTVNVDFYGTATSAGYNIIGDTTGSSGFGGTDQLNVDPLLGALADNGGLTMTHALLAGSTAIDAGTNTGAPATDQRGIARDATVDIGAFEFVPTSPGSAIWRDSGDNTPNVNNWDGSSFGTATDSANMGQWRIVEAAEAPTRDEKIVVGVDTIGQLKGEIWDGSTWTALPFSMGFSLDTTAQSFDVVYESQSGDAMVVWDNLAGGTASVSFRVWDGNTWSAEQTITAPDAGTAPQLRLAANPTSDEMILIVSDDNTDEWAAVWDGSSWGNTVVLDTAVAGDGTEIAVAYESQTGHAMVVYDGVNNYNDLTYQTWNGTSWSGQQTLTLPHTGSETDAEFTTLASDPTSDRIAIGVVSGGTQNQVLFAVWDGSAWGETLMATTSGWTGSSLNAAVAFESQSGDLLVTYGEASTTPRYQTWSSGGGWSGEMSLPDIGAYAQVMMLASDPLTNGIMLGVQDSDSDLHYIHWDGSAWGTDNEVSTNTGETNRLRPFTFVFDAAPPSSNAAPNIGLPGGAVNYTENDPATIIDATATVSDPDSANFDTGTLTVNLTVNGTANDRLTIRDQGPGPGNIEVSGNSIYYTTGPTILIGTFTGGTDGSTPLVITLNGGGNSAAVQALMRNITYENVSENPSELTRTVRFELTDGDGGTSNAETEIINVSAVNDDPTNAGSLPTDLVFLQDTQGKLDLSSIDLSDVDANGGNLTLTITSDNGHLQTLGWPGVTLGGSQSQLILTGNLTDLNDFLNDVNSIDYEHATPGANGNNVDRIVIQINDNGNTGSGGGSTILLGMVNIDITSTNVAPNDLETTATTDGGLSLNEDGGNDAYLIADDGGAILGGLTALTAEVRFSMDSFTNSTNFFSYANGLDDNVFKFNIRDNGDLSVSINSVKIDSSAMDFRLLADSSQHTLSVTWDSAGGLWEMFVDGASVDSGSGLENGMSLGGGGALVMGNDQDSVDGGYDPAAEVAATLYDARIFNDVRTAGEIAANYDQTLASTESGMLANWTFNDLSTSGVITDTVSGNNLTVSHASGAGFVTSTPVLTLEVGENVSNGTVVGTAMGTDSDGDPLTYQLIDNAGGRFAIDTNTGVITVADGSLLDYETTTTHNITVRVSDGNATYDEVFTVELTDLNDAPVLDTSGVFTFNTITEDQADNAGQTVASIITSAGGDRITDVDGDPEGIAVVFTGGSYGTWEYSLDGGSNWATVGSVSTGNALLLRDTDLLRFNPDGTAGTTALISFNAWDQSSGTAGNKVDATTDGGSTPFSAFWDNALLTVTDVNDAPVNTVPGPQVVAEDTLLALSGVSVNDVDGNLSTVELSVANGTLNVTLSGAATISAGANDSNTLTLSGSQVDINATLASLTYQGTLNYTGADSLTITSTDANSATDVDNVAITVTAVNDDPTNAGLLQSASVVTEDVSSTINLSAINLSDVDGGAGALTMTLTTSTGGNLTAAAGSGITIGGNGTGVVTLTGNLTDLNTYLDTVGTVTYLHSVANTSGFAADTDSGRCDGQWEYGQRGRRYDYVWHL